MKLFGFGKKESECCCGNEEQNAEVTCCCGEQNNESACCCGDKSVTLTSVKVLGAGCKSCHDQYEYAKKAVKDLNLEIEVEYVTDMEVIMGYGVTSMPAIVVNEKVVSMGKVLKSPEVIKLLGQLGY